jgi:hypothetical protein
VGESGMIRTQVGSHNRSEFVAVCGTPCAIRLNSDEHFPEKFKSENFPPHITRYDPVTLRHYVVSFLFVRVC